MLFMLYELFYIIMSFKIMYVCRNLAHLCRNTSGFKLLHTEKLKHLSSVKTSGSPRQTIYALSSAPGKAGVAVIRISGSQASDTLLTMTTHKKLPKERQATLRSLYSTDQQQLLDQALVIWFPGPHSFTGEDVCELHLHGGIATVNAVLHSLSQLKQSNIDIRHAEPGEYTRRSFENGCLDLTEVEGLADLISAETEAQRRQAILQLTGSLSMLYTKWTQSITKNVAAVEAFIDFSEDDNIEDGVIEQVSRNVDILRGEMKTHLSDERRGERIRSGLSVVIAGSTNVGKSSLLNQLCQRPAAIVSPLPGTTRDVVETSLNIAGFPIRVCDTAGLRETDDMIEQEGITRARQRLEFADLCLVLLDSTTLVNKGSPLTVASIEDAIHSHIKDLLQNTHSTKETDSKPKHDINDIDNSIVVLNKCDLLSADQRDLLNDVCDSINEKQSDSVCCMTSCTTDNGITRFVDVLAAKVKKMCGDIFMSNPALTQARHREHLTSCVESMETFLHILDLHHLTAKDNHGTSDPGHSVANHTEDTSHSANQTSDYDVDSDLVIACHHLRNALRHIGKVTGRVTTDDVLDVIFQDFCIGK